MLAAIPILNLVICKICAELRGHSWIEKPVCTCARGGCTYIHIKLFFIEIFSFFFFASSDCGD